MQKKRMPATSLRAGDGRGEVGMRGVQGGNWEGKHHLYWARYHTPSPCPPTYSSDTCPNAQYAEALVGPLLGNHVSCKCREQQLGRLSGSPAAMHAACLMRRHASGAVRIVAPVASELVTCVQKYVTFVYTDMKTLWLWTLMKTLFSNYSEHYFEETDIWSAFVSKDFRLLLRPPIPLP
jgi:hypothetical protein